MRRIQDCSRFRLRRRRVCSSSSRGFTPCLSRYVTVSIHKAINISDQIIIRTTINFPGNPIRRRQADQPQNFVYSIKTIFVLFLPLFGEQSLATLFPYVGY